MNKAARRNRRKHYDTGNVAGKEARRWRRRLRVERREVGA